MSDSDTSIVQDERDGERETVTPFELFFDLVFVFGFTQVTSLLVHDPTWIGLARGMLVLTALWWAWSAYAWLATTINLEDGLVRIVMMGVMCATLIAGIAAPGAFKEHAIAFATAYAVMRYLHILVYAIAARGQPKLFRNVIGLLPGTTLSVVAITAAAWLDGWTAIAAWCVLIIDMAAPLFIGAEGWLVSAEHFHERFGLIFLIALGESLIAVGIGVGGGAHFTIDFQLVTLASLGGVTVGALWWTYFDVVAIVAGRKLADVHGTERAAIARDSYSYLHLPMVAGAILYAVGIKKALSHPHVHLHWVPAIGLVGGVALYLTAHILFRLRNVRSLNKQRAVVVVLLVAVLVTIGTHVWAAVLVGIVAAIMVGLISYEALRFREARARVRQHASA